GPNDHSESCYFESIPSPPPSRGAALRPECRTPLTDPPGMSIVPSIPRKGYHADACAVPRADRTIGPRPFGVGRPRCPPGRELQSQGGDESCRPLNAGLPDADAPGGAAPSS